MKPVAVFCNMYMYMYTKWLPATLIMDDYVSASHINSTYQPATLKHGKPRPSLWVEFV